MAGWGLLLSGLFIASLVTCNLVFRKFFTWTSGPSPLNRRGVVALPNHVLVTDMIGDPLANAKPTSWCCRDWRLIMTLGVGVERMGRATAWSPVSNGNSTMWANILAVGAAWPPTCSLIVDVRIFTLKS